MIRVCIPTFNRAGRLALQLRQLSLARALGAELDVHVFDNASTDGASDLLRAAAERGELEWHPSPTNVGYSRNVWRILEFASSRWAKTGDHLWILSDDDYVFSANVAALCDRLQAEPRAGERPVLLSFVYFSGRSIRPRLPRANADDAWSADTFSAAYINQNALISGWLYPTARLDSQLLGELERWKDNAFVQIALLAALWHRDSALWRFDKPVGIEQINVLIRFQLRQAFAIDRTEAVRHLLTVAGSGPDLRSCMGPVAADFARRSVLWCLAGEEAAAREALEAVHWLRSQGLAPLRARVWGLVAALLGRMPACLRPSFLRSRASASLARLRDTQRVIDSLF